MSLELHQTDIFKSLLNSTRKISTQCLFDFSSKSVKILSADPDERCLFIHILYQVFFKKYSIKKPTTIVVYNEPITKFLHGLPKHSKLTIMIERNELVFLSKKNELVLELRIKGNDGQIRVPSLITLSEKPLAEIDLSGELLREILHRLPRIGDEMQFQIKKDILDIKLIDGLSSYTIKIPNTNVKFNNKMSELAICVPASLIRNFPFELVAESALSIKFFENGLVSFNYQEKSLQVCCYLSARCL